MEIQWVGKDILEIQMTGVELEKAIQILDILANDLLSLFLRGLQVDSGIIYEANHFIAQLLAHQLTHLLGNVCHAEVERINDGITDILVLREEIQQGCRFIFSIEDGLNSGMREPKRQKPIAHLSEEGVMLEVYERGVHQIGSFSLHLGKRFHLFLRLLIR